MHARMSAGESMLSSTDEYIGKYAFKSWLIGNIYSERLII
jgi:hypothetical protein